MKKTILAVLVLVFSFSADGFAAAAQNNLSQGESLFKKGLPEKSLVYFQAAVKADPENWKAYEELGNAYFKLGDNSKALDAYNESLNINPDNDTLQTLADSLKAQEISNGNNLPPVPVQSTDNAVPTTDSSGNKFEEASPNGGSSPSEDNTPPSTDSNGNKFQEASPSGSPSSVIPAARTPRPRAWNWRPVPSVASDGLNAIDHKRLFSSLELGYDYSINQDLINGAKSLDKQISNHGYTGSGTMQNSGFGFGAEVGVLLNPYNGIAFGARYLRSADYHLNETYPSVNPTNDFETLDIEPAVIPLTLDYYLFLPDSTGRFFISAGVGYYLGVLHVNQIYDDTNGDAARTRDPGYADNWSGNLYGGNIGFQVGLGREWAVTPRFGFSLFAKGYYAKISKLTGTMYDSSGVPLQFGLAKFPGGVTDVDLTSNIGGSGENYATLDFTGFEAGFAFTFYNY